MTILAVPVYGCSIDEVRANLRAAIEAGADVVELRVDMMEGVTDDEIRSLRTGEPGQPTLILTIRAAAEGGHWDGPDDERISRLVALGPIADYIDVELATWRRSANVREKVELALKRAGHISQADGKEEIDLARPRRLILSRHDTTGRPPTLQADFVAMLREDACHVPKLVWRARTIRDNFEAFELMRQSPRPAIVICTGEAGLLSRVLARKFGAFATFAAVSADRQTAEGQLAVSEMRCLYRWERIGPETSVYGVIGDPVAHSLSPHVHNAAFAEAGLDAVYVPLPVLPTYESFKAFMTEVAARRWLDFRGFSVTVPHKENAWRYLRAVGARLDPLAERIGAVNTVCIGTDGKLTGHNTDCPAAMQVIADGLTGTGHPRDPTSATGGADGVRSTFAAADAPVHDPTPVGAGDVCSTFAAADARVSHVPQMAAGGVCPALSPALGTAQIAEGDCARLLAGRRVAVLGAGGVARAIVAGLVEAGAEVTVYNRTEHKAAAIAKAFGCRHGPWGDRPNHRAELLVNCTSIGMWPDVEESPMPASAMNPGMTVFDTVYNPRETRLISAAAQRGCVILDGLTMFAQQAQAQFALWTGRRLPVELLRRKAAEALRPG